MSSFSLVLTRSAYRRVGLSATICAAVWLTGCGVAAWWAPDALRQAASDWAQAHGRKLQIGTVSINPFLWTANLDGIRLADRDGSTLLALKSLSLEAKPSALLLGRWRLTDLELDTPTINIARPAKGNWNWLQLFNELAGPPQPQSHDEPVKLAIDHLLISNGRIQLKDGIAKQAPWRLDNLTLALDDLTTLPVDGGYKLSATLDDGARLDWQGSLRLMPLSSAGQLHVDKLTLARIWPLLAPFVKLAAPQGTLDTRAHYKLAIGDRLSLDVTQLDAALHGLDQPAPGGASRFGLHALELHNGRFSLAQRQLAIDSIELNGGTLSARRDADGRLDWLGALPPAKPAAPSTATAAPAKPWRFGIDKVTLRDWKLGLRDDSLSHALQIKGALPAAGFKLARDKDGMTLEGLYAKLAELSLADEHGTAPITLAAAALEPGTLALDARRFAPGKLSLDGLAIRLNRDAHGNVDLVSLLSPRHAGAKPAAKTEQPGWQLTPPPVELRNGSVSWHDAATAQPVSLTLADLNGSGESRPGDKLALQLAGHSGGGRLDGHLLIGTHDGAAEGTLDLADLPLVPLAPYALSGTTLKLVSGTVSGHWKLALPAQGPWQLEGNAALGRFALLEPNVHDPLVGWHQLRVDHIAAHGGTPPAVSLGQLRLDAPRLRLILDKQRNLNLTRLFTPAGHETAKPNGTAATPRLEVRSVAVANGELDFADQSLSEAFFTRIHHLGGHIQGISNQGTRRGTVMLDGRVDNFGQAKVRGVLAPFAPTTASDILLAFRNIPLSSINPYSMTFAGWRVDDGRLNLDLRYHLKNRQLDGSNNVVIQSIKLGEPVSQPGGKSLPLKLAVALLEDSDGRIELNLPVTGQLDDPQFSYGHLVWQAFTNVVEKAVTAPFRALAHLFGKEGFDAVYFAAGQSAIDPPEQEKLDKLAILMNKRPTVSVTLAGTYDRDGEAKALARARVDRAILTGAGLKPEADLPLAIPDLDDAATRKAVRALYGERIGRFKLVGKLIGGDERTRYQDLRNELIKAEQDKLDDKAFQALAQARAEAARREILKEAPQLADRIRIGEPDKAHAGNDGVALSIKLDTGAAPLTKS